MPRILPVIVIAQFFCTSVWFAANAVLPDMINRYHPDPGYQAHLISAVQFGFITGTFLFAFFTIADRFSPSRVFFVSAVLAAIANMTVTMGSISLHAWLVSRFVTGLFLAGIYPVGMKIAADYCREGLGRSLGFLVGALVIGTAFPHLLKSISFRINWQLIIYATSALSVTGGFAILLFVPDGPYRKTGQRWNSMAYTGSFRNSNFRAAALGYFGHMWELYAFWAFVPVMLASYHVQHPDLFINIPLTSFLVIASGGLACVASGLMSRTFGTLKLAAAALAMSGLCCLLSPLILTINSFPLLVVYLLFWGCVVIADSPLFSALVAQNASSDQRGAAITIVNCIGFSITIVSIQVLNMMQHVIPMQYLYTVLAFGPACGLLALYKNRHRR